VRARAAARAGGRARLLVARAWRRGAMTPYGEIIHEHSRRPRNYGSLEAPDLRCEGHNPFCGDRVRVELRLTDDVVSAARFQGDLCVIAKAASSVLTEMIGGLPLRAVASLPDQQLLDA